MFTKKKEIRIPLEIKVKLYDIKGNGTTFHYEIPDGGSYRIQLISENLEIFDSTGTLINLICFQAGYTKEFEIIYKKENETL